MKIGRYVKNSEGVVEEVLEPTSYGNWQEANPAARALLADNESNENVCGVFVAIETSPDDYIIKKNL